MNRNDIKHLAIIVAVLVLLNLFFHLHISIIGSLALTIALSFVMNALQRRS